MPAVRVKRKRTLRSCHAPFQARRKKTGLLTELRAREAYEKPTTERQTQKSRCRQAPAKAPAQPTAAAENVLITACHD